MNYRESRRGLDTPRKILKVNHAGEFGAINIYRAQMIVCRWVMQRYMPMLQHFLEDETRHLNLFWQEIQNRNGVKCKSFWLCGVGGYAMGFISALLGTKGIMACTWAVESVVAGCAKHNPVEPNQGSGCYIREPKHPSRNSPDNRADPRRCAW